MIITTMDLGSNSFRVLQYDCKTDQFLGEFDKTVGTADGLKKSGIISKEAQTRVINAINEAKHQLIFDPSKVVAVTTQAMRAANNSEEVIQNIFKETGIKFTIIDGEIEAKLTLLAIKQALKREKIDNKKFVALDIGGGSTELIIVDDEVQVQSFAYGIVTLSQSDKRDKELADLKKLVSQYIQSKDLKEYNFIATAGTPTTIAAVMHGLNYQTYDKQIINGTKVNLSHILAVQNELLSLSETQLEEKVGTGRSHYIDTGIEIFKLFYTTLEKEQSMVFDDGLREGVAINYCLEHLHRL